MADRSLPDLPFGCYADGSLGHQHCRLRLSDVLFNFEVLYPGSDAESYRVERVRASLERPMPDDAWDELEALEYLNDHQDVGVWEFIGGDLHFSEGGER